MQVQASSPEISLHPQAWPEPPSLQVSSSYCYQHVSGQIFCLTFPLVLSPGHPPVFQQQRPFTPSPHSHTNLGPHTGTPGPAHPLPVQPHVLPTPQSQPVSSPQTQTQSQQSQNKARPLLLEEQPLLLQDLLDQERQEQQQQKQMQALIRQKPASESVLPNTGKNRLHPS